MDSMSVQATFRTSQTLGDRQTLGSCLSPRWLSTIRDGRPRLRGTMTPTSEPPSKPASAKLMPLGQAHQLASRLPEPNNLLFPTPAKGTHSLIYHPWSQRNHLCQPFQITISRRQNLTLS